MVNEKNTIPHGPETDRNAPLPGGPNNKYSAGTEDEMIDRAAARILEKYRPAFEELAK